MMRYDTLSLPRQRMGQTHATHVFGIVWGVIGLPIPVGIYNIDRNV